ncbi:MAG: 30S ribosomal protein S16 [Coriobacteriales bacterium]|nr:30S ribosomal protein S16 [Coriobacteriales bacterium]
MAVKIRLARHGAKKAPYYRVVVADARARRDGRFIEEVGRYNPCATPTMIKLELDKIDAWITNGAQPTETVAKLIAQVKEELVTQAKEA